MTPNRVEHTAGDLRSGHVEGIHSWNSKFVPGLPRGFPRVLPASVGLTIRGITVFGPFRYKYRLGP